METWDIIDSIDKKIESPPQPNSTNHEVKNEVAQTTETIEVETDTINENAKFDWLEAIKNLLMKKEKKEIKVKRLKKKVLVKYFPRFSFNDFSFFFSQDFKAIQ